MLRRVEQCCRVRLLDDAPEIHYRDTRCHMLDDSQIVTDDDVCQTEFFSQILKQIENLRLHRHIERTCGFIADNDLRPVDQRARNSHALALATGKLVRKIVVNPLRKADELHHFLSPSSPGVRVPVPLNPQGQSNNVANGLAWIQRGIGILKDGL